MKVEKFNDDSTEKLKPYSISLNGLLTEITDKNKFKLTPNVYLTDSEYLKIKKLADNTVALCDLMDDNKKQYVDLLRGAIQKIKSDKKIQ